MLIRNVRFTLQSGHEASPFKESAKCQKRTHAPQQNSPSVASAFLFVDKTSQPSEQFLKKRQRRAIHSHSWNGSSYILPLLANGTGGEGRR
jgi:hypothetical protein